MVIAKTLEIEQNFKHTQGRAFNNSGVYDLKTALVSVFYKECAQGSWPYFCRNQIFLFHGWFWAGIKGPRI